MYPILGRTPYGFIYSYTVVYALAIFLCVGLTAWQARQEDTLVISKWFDGVLWVIIGGVLGGRISFVSANWDYFRENTAEIWRPLQGGYGYHGALLAGLVTLWLWSRWQRVPFSELADLLAPALALASTCGWLACLLDGCAFGRESFIAWYAADLPDSFGVYAVRFQTQLGGLLLSSLITLGSYHLPIQKEGPSAKGGGHRFWLTLAALSCVHFTLTFFRADAMPVINGVRFDTIVAAGTAVVAVVLAWRPLGLGRS